ncbi:hypothetical protein CLOP_g8059 [Closterium sp. NIES-67]|nr:hypothetical protein CLOP_g8059 [Closterium sp. NIES-67]
MDASTRAYYSSQALPLLGKSPRDRDSHVCACNLAAPSLQADVSLPGNRCVFFAPGSSRREPLVSRREVPLASQPIASLGFWGSAFPRSFLSRLATVTAVAERGGTAGSARGKDSADAEREGVKNRKRDKSKKREKGKKGERRREGVRGEGERGGGNLERVKEKRGGVMRAGEGREERKERGKGKGSKKEKKANEMAKNGRVEEQDQFRELALPSLSQESPAASASGKLPSGMSSSPTALSATSTPATSSTAKASRWDGIDPTKIRFVDYSSMPSQEEIRASVFPSQNRRSWPGERSSGFDESQSLPSQERFGFGQEPAGRGSGQARRDLASAPERTAARGSGQVWWSEEGRDEPEIDDNSERDRSSKSNSTSSRGSSSGNRSSSNSSRSSSSSSRSGSSSSRSSSRRIRSTSNRSDSCGNPQENAHGSSSGGESDEFPAHDYNEYSYDEWEEGEQDEKAAEGEFEATPRDYNEYNKYIPGWEWEEGEQEEEAAESEFEAVAQLWEEMEGAGKLHPLSAPAGGLRWKQEAQERFPDLARMAGVFPYMGDVIEREELDTPYDYAPPPDIDSRSSDMIDKLQDLLTALRLFLPYALSPLPAPPPVEGGEKAGEGAEEKAREGGAGDSQVKQRKQVDQQRQEEEQQLRQQQQRQQQQQQQQRQQQPQAEEPVDIFAMGFVEDEVRVQNPVVCVRGRHRWQQWLHVMGSAGGHLHLHNLYSETLVKEPDRRWITALWTILLAKSGREAVAAMGLTDWWDRNLPEHEAEIRRNLPAEEEEEEGERQGNEPSNRGAKQVVRKASADKMHEDPRKEGESFEAPQNKDPRKEGPRGRIGGSRRGEGDEEGEEDVGSDVGGEVGMEWGAKEAERGDMEGKGGEKGADEIYLIGKTRFEMNTDGKISAVESTWFIADDPMAVRETARGELFLRALLLIEEEKTLRQV